MDSDNPQNSFRNRKRSMLKMDLLLRVYSILGFLAAILSVGYFLISLLDRPLTHAQQVSVIVAGVGVTVAVFSRVLMLVFRDRNDALLAQTEEYEAIGKLLEAWRQFERASKEALKKEGKEFQRHSLSSLISRLAEEGKLDKGDVAALEEALQMRNAVVHSQQKVSPTILEKVIKAVGEITQKIALSTFNLH